MSTDIETEYLSPRGWQRLSDYNGGKVMQYWPDEGTGEFVEPREFIVRVSDGFFHLKTHYGVNQMLSRDHRVLCWQRYGRDRAFRKLVVSAEEYVEEHHRLVQGNRAAFQTSFTPKLTTQLALSDEALRVQVMVMADGYFPEKYTRPVVVQFRKQRKIDRARVLLKELDINFVERPYPAGDTTTFKFIAPIATKTYAEFWIASLRQLGVIASECLYWDGTLADNVFFTRDRYSADFIHYAMTATGQRSILRVDVAEDGTDYRVFGYPETMVAMASSVKARVTEVSSADGFEYCFTVPSGFWVARRQGAVFMTGSC